MAKLASLCTLVLLYLVTVLGVGGQESLSDATAIVDRLFTYSLPSSAKVVTETGKDSLPNWLSFDSSTHTLVGVPTVKDKGTCIISVDQDMFAITVTVTNQYEVAQPSHDSADVKPVNCKPEDSITEVKVVFNSDFDQLSPSEKSELIRKFSKHLELKQGHVSLRTSRHNEHADLSSALVSGLGDKKMKPNDYSSVFSWVVGCGAVKSHQMDILERLEITAKDGSLSRALKSGEKGGGINGWQVNIIRQQNAGSKRRLKRQVGITATPSPSASTDSSSTTETSSVVTPTSTVETSATTTPSPMPPSLPPPITPPPRPRNLAPVVNPEVETPIKLNMISGRLGEWRIPDDLFSDPEGDRIEYKLLHYSTSRDVNTSPNSWLMYDRINNNIIALPLDGNTGVTMFVLRASDSKSLHTDVTIMIRVSEKQLEGITELYHMTLSAPFTDSSRHILDLMFTLRETLKGEPQVDRVVGQPDGDTLVVFGIPLSDITTCPSDNNRMQRVSLRRLDTIQLIMYYDISQVYVKSVKTTPMLPCKNTMPAANYRLQLESQYIATVGQLFEVKIPTKLFEDEEDIDLRFMELDLKYLGTEIPSTSWVGVDKSTNTLRGLPWDIDSPQMFQYTLIATDSGGLTAEYEIELRVVSSPQYSDPTNLFTITIDDVFSQFANNREAQIMMYNKLKSAFSRAGNPTVYIDSITPGSVVIGFNLFDESTGKTNPCQTTEGYINMMFTEEGEVKRDFVEAIAPYKVTKASFAPLGLCEGVLGAMEANVKGPTTDQGTQKEELNIIFIIIPVAIVVALIIIIVIAICCIRSRKRKSHNVSKSNGTYIETGIPVILDEERRDNDKAAPHEIVPLMDHENNKPKPPAYPEQNGKETTPLNSGKGAEDGYQPPTPPVSDHGDHDR